MVKNEATMLVLAVPIKKQVEHFDGAQVIPMDPSKSLQRFHQVALILMRTVRRARQKCQ